MSKTYYEVLASRIPNNHCLICSHFHPTEDDQKGGDEEGRLPRKYKENSVPCMCPSCGRGARRYFIPVGSPSLERVPDDWVTQLHGSPEFCIKQVEPFHAREGFDFEAWQKHLKDKKNKAPVVEHFPYRPFKTPTPDTSGMGTPMRGMRLKVG